jgi:hypothetical protein
MATQSEIRAAEQELDDAFAELFEALESLDERKAQELAAATIAHFAIAMAADR